MLLNQYQMIVVQVISKRTRFFQLVQPLLKEARIESISVIDNSESAFQLVDINKTELVLLDANFVSGSDKYSTPQLITSLRKLNPAVKIILFTNTKEEFMINQMQLYHINGYIWLSMDNFISTFQNCLCKVLQSHCSSV